MFEDDGCYDWYSQDDLADYNAMEADDYRHEGDYDSEEADG